MQFLFRLQNQLTFIIDTNADTGDGLIGQLKSDRSSRQHVVTIGFRECQSGMRCQLTDSKIETPQNLYENSRQIERLALKIKQGCSSLCDFGRCSDERIVHIDANANQDTLSISMTVLLNKDSTDFLFTRQNIVRPFQSKLLLRRMGLKSITHREPCSQ